jgi:undecaprenyl-diphosphatase
MDTLIIFCAKYLIWVIVAAALGYVFFSTRRMRLALSAALSLVLAYAAGWVAGHVWYNPRPFAVDGTTPLIPHDANNGFPSDHMLLGAAVASIVFVYNRTLGVVLWVLALAVGAARVAAGIHHWVDIAGAIAISVIAVAVVEYVLRRWRALDPV